MTRRLLLLLIGSLALAASGCIAPSDPLPPPTTKPSVRILFIGNSYTFFNGGVDRMLTELAAQRGKTIECVPVVSGGRSLAWHWEQSDARAMIARGKWDWVVLQDYSTQPLKHPDEMAEAIRNFDRAIKAAGAKTALFMTWARESGPEDQPQIAAEYLSLGNELGATVVPVGLAWQRAREEMRDQELYRFDGSHPTAEGTYLAACCFQVALLHGDPRGLTAPLIDEQGLPPRRLRDDHAALLQRIAWETARQR
ncbi:MAG TPA: hypothetical protein VH518_18530 [Tepidisphaeraceae bacterium]